MVAGRSGASRVWASGAIVLAGLAIAQIGSVAGRAQSAPASSPSGATAYTRYCASCHGATLDGMGGPNSGPALKGEAFLARWKARQASAFLSFVHDAMPVNQPGSLDRASSDAAANFVLASNGLPTGSAAAAGAGSGSPERASSTDLTSKEADRDATYHQVMADRAALLSKVRPVDDQALVSPSGADWLAWRGSTDSHAYSTLDQINRQNVAQLRQAWSLSLDPGINSIAPLVHDGVMFLNNNGTVLALDARNGDLLWEYARPMAAHNPSTTQPRSMALGGTSLFVPTLDNHMLALDIRTGKLLWDHEIAPPDDTVQITAAPLVAHGKVIQGMSWCVGNGHPGGCYIVAMDAATGKELWRFNTIARPGEPNGDSWNGAPLEKRYGASVWQTGSYDPDLNLVYFGVGQTYIVSSLLDKQARKGASNDALYTNSTLALDPDTGKLVWHYQHTQADVWDMDWSFERTITTDASGRKVIVTAGKLGIFDALDARTGHYLWSVDPGYQTLVIKIDPRTGHKTYNPDFAPPVPGKTSLICPGAIGNRNWPSTAYDPKNQLIFVPLSPNCMAYQRTVPPTTPDTGHSTNVSEMRFDPRRPPNSDGQFGLIAAIDIAHQRVAWIDKRRAANSSAMLATAGGLVFGGGRDRAFRALDAATGAPLWQSLLPSVPSSFPLSYAVDGKQYVAVVTGGRTAVDTFLTSTTPELPRSSNAKTVVVFALP